MAQPVVETVQTESSEGDGLREANIKICQTDTLVLVSIIEPGLRASDVDVMIEPHFFQVYINRMDLENPVMSGTLFGAIEKAHCRVRVKPESVVIKLRKTIPGRWKSILQEATSGVKPVANPQAKAQTKTQQGSDEKKPSADPEPKSSTSPLANITPEPKGATSCLMLISPEPQSSFTPLANVSPEPQKGVTRLTSINKEPQGATTAGRKTPCFFQDPKPTTPLASISHKPPCFFVKSPEDPSVIDCSKMEDDDEFPPWMDEITPAEEREPATPTTLIDTLRERAAAEAIKERERAEAEAIKEREREAAEAIRDKEIEAEEAERAADEAIRTIEERVSKLKSSNEAIVAALAKIQNQDPTELIDGEVGDEESKLTVEEVQHPLQEVKHPIRPNLRKPKRQARNKEKPCSSVKVSPGVKPRGTDSRGVKGMMDTINMFFNPSGFLNPPCGPTPRREPALEETSFTTRSFHTHTSRSDLESSDDPWSEEETISDFEDESNVALGGRLLKKAEAILGDIE